MSRIRVVLLAFLAVSLAGLARLNLDHPNLKETGRNKAPLTRVKAEKLERPGLENFYRVTPGLYRGAQPSAEGMKELSKMGIKTIINLRLLHSDRDEIGDLPLGYEHIRMEAWRPEDDEVVRFLKVVMDRDHLPVFVHCRYGSDRTGTMCAIYRIAVCGWSREEAMEEMTKGGFGFHEVWDELVEYVRNVDIDGLKK